MMEESHISQVPPMNLNPYQNPTDYYYNALQEFSQINSKKIQEKKIKYGLTKEGVIDTIQYNYYSTLFDYKFYFTQGHHYILKRFYQDLENPTKISQFQFTEKELHQFIKNQTTNIKRIYNQIKWKYWWHLTKYYFCSCWPWCWNSNSQAEYQQLVNW